MSEHKCEEKVYRGVGFRCRAHPCGRNAKYEEAGRWYCKTHLPSEKTRRDAERSAKWTRNRQCTWTYDSDGVWATSCEHTFCFNDGGPTENHFTCCCYCGKPLVEVPWVDDYEDDE